MVLSRILFIYFAMISLSYAKSKLPELITKQAVNNLRFISRDGKFTYYQRRSGSLLLGTNYKVREILTGKIGTNYVIISSSARKKLLITKNENYHTLFSPRIRKNIYIIDFQGGDSIFLGKGIRPRLHLNDTWVSYYDAYSKKITLKKGDAPEIKKFIKIMSGTNPYFIPQIVMTDINTILFTDINKKGIPGIIHYSKNSNKSKNIYTVPSQNKKIELCKKEDHIIVGEFGIDPIESYSSISLVPINTLELSKKIVLYTSQHNDVGNIICSLKGDFIYFIKNTFSETKKNTHEVARLNIKNKAVDIISDVSHATQVIDMDSKLLLPFQGKYYVLLGKNNTAQFDLLKKKDKK